MKRARVPRYGEPAAEVASTAVSGRFERWFAIDSSVSAPDRAAFAAARAEHNLRRVRVFVPLMLVVHLAHVIALRMSDEARRALPPADVRWHDGLWADNAAMIPVSVLLILLAGRSTGGRAPSLVQRHLGELTFAAYMTHAAVSSVVDQHITASIHAFVIGALAPAVVFRVSLPGACIAYAAGLVTLWIGTQSTQESESLRLSNLAGASTVAALGLVLAGSMSRAMARAFRDKRLIEQKTDELGAANRGLEAIKRSLEERVAAQVGEIVQRASEVERLNAQLMERVRERSEELSRALAQLASTRPAQGDLTEGSELGGRVVIGRLLGRGGMGAVYAGRDRVSDSEVAVKVVRATNADELDALHRFLREARAAASISHAGIVRSLHVDVDEEGRFFQILELVHGETLSQRLARMGALPPAHAARIGAVLAGALAAAHRAGVVHRDVKPQNIMLTTAEPGVKLLDFGIAKAQELAAGELGRTRTGMIIGTPEFMAPEQIERPLDVTAASDVYSLGLVLFLMVSARLAFEPPGGPAAFLFAHIAVPPPRLEDVVPGVPRELAELVGRCLRKAPGERPSVDEVRASLERIANEGESPDATVLARIESADSVVLRSDRTTHAQNDEDALTRAAPRPG